MRLQEDGDIEVAPGEVITVTVTAVRTHYLAIFSDLLESDWRVVKPLAPLSRAADGSAETRRFVVGRGPREAFTIQCDFVRNTTGDPASGAEYLVEVESDRGDLRIRKRILPIAPFPVMRPFVFEVQPDA